MFVYAYQETSAKETKTWGNKRYYVYCHSMKIDNRSIERVEEFKYLGTTSTNKNSIQEEIKSRLKVGNASYHSVQIFCLPVCYQKS